jgi:hypothetical protein
MALIRHLRKPERGDVKRHDIRVVWWGCSCITALQVIGGWEQWLR